MNPLTVFIFALPFVISIVANEENDAFARTQGGLRRRDLWSNDGWLNIGHHYYHHKSWSHNTITSSHQRARVPDKKAEENHGFTYSIVLIDQEILLCIR